MKYTTINTQDRRLALRSAMYNFRVYTATRPQPFMSMPSRYWRSRYTAASISLLFRIVASIYLLSFASAYLLSFASRQLHTSSLLCHPADSSERSTALQEATVRNHPAAATTPGDRSTLDVLGYHSSALGAQSPVQDELRLVHTPHIRYLKLACVLNHAFEENCVWLWSLLYPVCSTSKV